MKLCILTRFYYPMKTGGAEVFSYALSQLMAKKGHEVHVVRQDMGTKEVMSSEEGIHVHRIKFPSFFKPPFYTLGCLFYFYQVIKVLKKVKPDIVHAIQTNFNGSYGLIVAKLLRLPFFINDHGGYNILPWWHRKIVSYFILKNVDGIVVPSQHLKGIISREHRHLEDKIHVIPNGLFLKEQREYTKEDARKLLRWDKGCFMITFIGSLSKIKRPLFALKIAEHLKSSFSSETNPLKFRLNLIGEGPERGSVERYIKERSLSDVVSLFGLVKKELIPVYISASDVIILPSLVEYYSNILLESLVRGCLVVASDVGCVSEIVEDGKNGFLIQPNDLRGFVKAIKKLGEEDATLLEE